MNWAFRAHDFLHLYCQRMLTASGEIDRPGLTSAFSKASGAAKRKSEQLDVVEAVNTLTLLLRHIDHAVMRHITISKNFCTSTELVFLTLLVKEEHKCHARFFLARRLLAQLPLRLSR